MHVTTQLLALAGLAFLASCNGDDSFFQRKNGNYQLRLNNTHGEFSVAHDCVEKGDGNYVTINCHLNSPSVSVSRYSGSSCQVESLVGTHELTDAFDDYAEGTYLCTPSGHSYSKYVKENVATSEPFLSNEISNEVGGWSSEETNDGWHGAWGGNHDNTKQFCGLGSTNQIRLTLQYHFDNSWDNERGHVSMSGGTTWNWEQYCSHCESYNSGVADVDSGWQNHDGDCVTVTIGADLDQSYSDEGYRFKAVKLQMAGDPCSGPDSSMTLATDACHQLEPITVNSGSGGTSQARSVTYTCAGRGADAAYVYKTYFSSSNCGFDTEVSVYRFSPNEDSQGTCFPDYMPCQDKPDATSIDATQGDHSDQQAAPSTVVMSGQSCPSVDVRTPLTTALAIPNGCTITFLSGTHWDIGAAGMLLINAGGTVAIETGASVGNKGRVVVTGSLLNNGFFDSDVKIIVQEGGILVNDGRLINRGTLTVDGLLVNKINAEMTNCGLDSGDGSDALIGGIVIKNKFSNLGHFVNAGSVATKPAGSLINSGTVSNTGEQTALFASNQRHGNALLIKFHNQCQCRSSQDFTKPEGPVSVLSACELELVIGNYIVESGQTLTIYGRLHVGVAASLTVMEGGSVKVSSGGFLEIMGQLNSHSGSINVDSGAGLVNRGEFSADGAAETVIDGVFENSGAVNTQLGTEIIIAGSGALLNLEHGSMDVSGGIAVESNANYVNQGSVVSRTNFVIDGSYSSTGNLDVYGNWTVKSGATFENNYALNLYGDLKVESGATFENANGATTTIKGDATMTNQGTINNRENCNFVNEGTFSNEQTMLNEGTVDNQNTFETSGTFTNAAGATLENDGSQAQLTVSGSGVLTNSATGGTIRNQNQATMTVAASGSIVNNADIHQTQSSTIEIEAQGTLTNNANTGEIYQSSGSTLDVQASGAFNNYGELDGGTIDVSGSLNNYNTALASMNMENLWVRGSASITQSAVTDRGQMTAYSELRVYTGHTIQPNSNVDWALSCPIGLERDASSQSGYMSYNGCHNCHPGYAKGTKISYNTACAACQPGYFQNSPGQAQCLVCGPSKYEGSTASTGCDSIQPGYYGVGGGPTTHTAQTACSPGYKCAGGSGDPVSCGSSNYQGGTASTGCNPIQPGYYGAGGGPTTHTSQTACSAGFKCTGGSAGPVACSGSYQDQPTQSSCKSCTNCGYKDPQGTCGGASDYSGCACPPGQTDTGSSCSVPQSNGAPPAPASCGGSTAGSWAQSCDNMSTNGCTLEARCRTVSGNWIWTSITMSCNSISNCNGNLQCGGC